MKYPTLFAACLASAACVYIGLAPAPARAQSTASLARADGAYEPKAGQEGKDVVWVPSPQALVDRMLDMAGLTKDDYHIDLGSGDGRTVITAAKRGARTLGIEYNPDLVALSQRAAAAAGVSDRARFVQGDIFETDFSSATVLTMFLLPELNLRLRPTILNMAPGTRVISNTFMMDDWQPDETIDAGGSCQAYCRAHKWIVPAKVEGVWRWPEGELTLTQTFQTLSGFLTHEARKLPIANGLINGTEINFEIEGKTYVGKLTGGRIEGRKGNEAWIATRLQ